MIETRGAWPWDIISEMGSGIYDYINDRQQNEETREHHSRMEELAEQNNYDNR
jgi:hypothetical protein